MNAKQVSITLEQNRQTQTHQTFERGPGNVGEGPWTVVKELPAVYVVTQMRNAVVLDLGSRGPNDLQTLRVGDVLTEAQAQEIARVKVFQVTVKA